MRVAAAAVIMSALYVMFFSFFDQPDYLTKNLIDGVQWRTETDDQNLYDARIARALSKSRGIDDSVKCGRYRFKQLTNNHKGPFWIQCYPDITSDDIIDNYFLSKNGVTVNAYISENAMFDDLDIE